MTQRNLSITPLAWSAIFGVALLWGGSFLSIRVAVQEVPILTVVAMRVSGAALVLWLYVLVRGVPLPGGSGAWGALFVMGLLNNVLPFTLITWGQQHIATGLASILNAATAIFGVLVAALFLRDERLTRRKLIGVALGFAGVATAIGLDNLRRLDVTSLAQLALIGSSMSYALSGVWARVALQGIRPQVAAAAMLTCSSAVMIPLALAIDGAPHLNYSPQAFAAIGYLSVFASALAYILFYWLLGRVGAANTSVVTLLVAPIAIVLGALVLDETLRPAAYAGFGLLTLGLLVLDGRLAAWVRRPRVA